MTQRLRGLLFIALGLTWQTTAQASACDLNRGTSNVLEPTPIALPRSETLLEQSGYVKLIIRFTSSGEPEVKVRGPVSAPDFFVQRVIEHVRAYRLRCELVNGESFTFERSFVLAFESTPPKGRYLKDPIDLYAFLSILRAGESTPAQARFDLGRMDCPFLLIWRAHQPAKPNVLEQAEPPHPERQSLMDWLATLKLRLNPFERLRMAGVPVHLHVPCGQLDGDAALRKAGWAPDLIDFDEREAAQPLKLDGLWPAVQPPIRP